MSSLLKNNSNQSQNPMNPKLVLGGAFILAFLASGVWYMVSFSNTHTTASSEAGAEGKRGSNNSYSRSNKKLAAYEMKKQLLEADQRNMNKYRRQQRDKKSVDKPDRYKARRTWRDDKERLEAAYQKQFKNDPTSDVDSVKVHMQNRIKQLEDDAPQR